MSELSIYNWRTVCPPPPPWSSPLEERDICFSGYDPRIERGSILNIEWYVMNEGLFFGRVQYRGRELTLISVDKLSKLLR